MKKNEITAYAWGIIASSNGAQNDDFLNYLGESLSPKQIAMAQSQAAKKIKENWFANSS